MQNLNENPIPQINDALKKEQLIVKGQLDALSNDGGFRLFGISCTIEEQDGNKKYINLSYNQERGMFAFEYDGTPHFFDPQKNIFIKENTDGSTSIVLQDEVLKKISVAIQKECKNYVSKLEETEGLQRIHATDIRKYSEQRNGKLKIEGLPDMKKFKSIRLINNNFTFELKYGDSHQLFNWNDDIYIGSMKYKMAITNDGVLQFVEKEKLLGNLGLFMKKRNTGENVLGLPDQSKWESISLIGTKPQLLMKYDNTTQILRLNDIAYFQGNFYKFSTNGGHLKFEKVEIDMQDEFFILLAGYAKQRNQGKDILGLPQDIHIRKFILNDDSSFTMDVVKGELPIKKTEPELNLDSESEEKDIEEVEAPELETGIINFQLGSSEKNVIIFGQTYNFQINNGAMEFIPVK